MKDKNKKLIATIKDYIQTQVLPVSCSVPLSVQMQYEAESLTSIIEQEYLLIPKYRKEIVSK
jgi:hypothetical protein